MRRMIVTIFALLFLGKMAAGARAEERLNLAYISPDRGFIFHFLGRQGHAYI